MTKMDEHHNEVSPNVHICDKCKRMFADIESFLVHKTNHCASDEDTIKLPDCMDTLNSTSSEGAECNGQEDNCIEQGDTSSAARSASPIVQTVMLASGLADGNVDTAGTFINEKGESLHFVVLPGPQCTHCSKFFHSSSALEDHINQCHSQPVDNSFPCSQCNRTCKTAASLKKHLETHTVERPFTCTYEGCTYTFKTKGSLVRHERRHTDTRPFKCELCGRAFRESGALARHRKSRMPCNQKRDTELPNYGKNMPLPGQAKAPETEQDPLETHLLSEEFLVPELSNCKDSELFLESVKSNEMIDKTTGLLSDSKESDAMERYTKDIMQLEEEQLVHNLKSAQSATVTVHVVHDSPSMSVQGIDSVSPNVDNSIDQGTEALNHSREGQQPVPVAEYFTSCQMCGLHFTKTSALKEHLKEHLSTGAFLCDQCSFVGTRQEFTAHITHTHSAPATASTELMSSERLYDSKSLDLLRTVSPQQAVREAIQLIQQLLILDNAFAHESLSEVKEKVLTLKSIKNCPVCDKTFRSPSYLRHHIRVHTGERPYKCKLCPKDFPTKDTFKKHMLCHSDERSFKCGECGKLFKRITHAKEHLKIHSNDRPYSCNICKKSFKTATIYKVHARTHTMHMPWVCKICSKRFREKASLTRHVRVHTGDKPFKCGYCEKSFSEHGTLSRHLRAKVPCSTRLGEARRPSLKSYPSEEQIQTIVITEDGDIACPTVLNEFSAVVTDTQKYLPPTSQQYHSSKSELIHTSDLDGLSVSDEGGSTHGTYYIVDGEVRLAYAVQPNALDQQEGKGEDEVEYEQPTSAQYAYLDNLTDGDHPMSLTVQAASDQVILMDS